MCQEYSERGWMVGRCWEACPSWVPVSLLISPRGSQGLRSTIRTLQDTSRTEEGRGKQGSEVRGVLLDPSPPLVLSPIYDGLDLNVTFTITWFYPNHEMVSCRIYRLSICGEHSITHDVALREGLSPACWATMPTPCWQSWLWKQCLALLPGGQPDFAF